MRKIIYNNENALIDSGIFFGRGVFETILVKGKAHFLEEHIKRLNIGIDKLSLGDSIRKEAISNFIQENNIDNLALKIIVTEKNIIFITREIKYKAEDYIKGFNVRLAKGMRNSKSPLTYLKSLNYLDNILEYEEATKDGYNEALFLNEKEQITEGCTTNVFIIKDNIIYTPIESSGLLKGTVRNFIIKNFKVLEKEICKEELLQADEVFLTNSLVGVIKVSAIEGNKYNSKLTEEIRKFYEDYINIWRDKNNG